MPTLGKDTCPFTGQNFARLRDGRGGTVLVTTPVLRKEVALTSELCDDLPRHPETERLSFRRWVADLIEADLVKAGTLPPLLTAEHLMNARNHPPPPAEVKAARLLSWMVMERKAKYGIEKEFDFGADRVGATHEACLITETERGAHLIPYIEILRDRGYVEYPGTPGQTVSSLVVRLTPLGLENAGALPVVHPSGGFGAAVFGEAPFSGGGFGGDDRSDEPAGAPSDGEPALDSLDDFTRNRTVARTASTPRAVLATLANSLHAEIRQAVAGNSSTSPDVLESLARDQDAAVRSAVRANAATPPHVLTWLETDVDPDIRKAANDDPRNPFNGSADGGDDGRRAVSGRLIVSGREEIETPRGYVRLYVRPVTDKQVADAVSRNRTHLAASLSLLIDALNAFLSAHNVLDAGVLEKLREVRLRAEEFRAAVPAALDGNLKSAAHVGLAASTLVQLSMAAALGFVGGVGSGIGDGVLKLVTSASAEAAAQVCIEVNPELISQLAKSQTDRKSQ